MEIKDYLKYYIGQQGNYEGRIGFLTGIEERVVGEIFTRLDFRKDNGEYISSRIVLSGELKMILRRLSSITEEEKLHIVENITHSHIAFSASNAEILTLLDVDKYLNRSRVMELLPEEFHYLLSRGFWLWDESAFTTGLIIEKK